MALEGKGDVYGKNQVIEALLEWLISKIWVDFIVSWQVEDNQEDRVFGHF
jgi:hypothetical protein